MQEFGEISREFQAVWAASSLRSNLLNFNHRYSVRRVTMKSVGQNFYLFKSCLKHFIGHCPNFLSCHLMKLSKIQRLVCLDWFWLAGLCFAVNFGGKDQDSIGQQSIWLKNRVMLEVTWIKVIWFPFSFVMVLSIQLINWRNWAYVCIT